MEPIEPSTDDTTFYTATMARIHRQQGRYDRAATIYRHLLSREGDNDEYRTALDEVAALARLQASDRLTAAVGRWLDLVMMAQRSAVLGRMADKHNKGRDS